MKPVREPGPLGHFIQNYSSFLSSFVIGLAGLCATSIYQCNQSELSRRQADSQQHIAETEAQNSWRIERAKILSDNLRILTAQGDGNVESRYGVLLSLTRGNILDPELAVSYALELGKENPEYMRSVLQNTTDKDYHRLANAFTWTCDQRYGLARPVDLCKNDKWAGRSAALAELIGEDTDVALAKGQVGPLILLKDEREVHADLYGRFFLFEPYLVDLYERRQWETLNRFSAYSSGARLIETLALSTVHNGELDTSAEAQQVEEQHRQASQYLRDYLLGANCNGECKAKLVGLMLSSYHRSQGNFDVPLRALLELPRADIIPPLTRINQRLLLCQVSADDVNDFRDRVLVPAIADLLKKPRAGSALDDLVPLLALVPDPTDPAARKAWDAVVQAIEAPPRSPHYLQDRRAAVKARRAKPTPSMKKTSFCNLADTEPDAAAQDDKD